MAENGNPDCSSMTEKALPHPHDVTQRDRYLDTWNSKFNNESDTAIKAKHLRIGDFTLLDVLNCVFGNSPFLSKAATRHPHCLLRIAELGARKAWIQFIDTFKNDISTASLNIQALKTLLREKKEEAALHIAICDLCHLWDLSEVTQRLSDFADMCVSTSLSTLLKLQAEKDNIQIGDVNDPQSTCGIFVLALGKLGARELNYSSDIDLMVLFDIDRLGYSGSKSPQEFVVKLTKELIRILDERTAQGYVFRTDLRLRPDPGSTAIAVSTESAELYYESWGQNWERSALIKARVIAGDVDAGRMFLKRLEPFVWRKSLDFYAIQDIHSIKRQIYASKGGREIDLLGHDIKIGRGGIREIEFFVQIQQLIWGGRNPDLRDARTLDALKSLRDNDLVTDEAVRELSESYIFLRSLEHRIQMINDEQTQKIPVDEAQAEALSVFFGFEEFGSFGDAVRHHLRQVERHYADLFEEAPDLTIEGNLVFTGTDHDPDTLNTLSHLGFENPETVSQVIRSWHVGKYRATKSTRARQILTEIVPSLVSAFGKTTQPDRALIKFDSFLGQLPAGVQLFSVFYTHPEVLELVADIMGDAPRLADYLTASSERLDYVLDPDFFEDLPTRAELSIELDEVLERADGFEATLDACRRWTNDLRFRVGVQALQSLLTPSIGGRALTHIAETTIQSLVPYVCEEFSRQFGSIDDADLAILAYGKLASAELMPSSDLDIVFVYSCRSETESTGGKRSLPASVYYMRLAQRIVSALTVLTAEGRLYDVDLRLRPSGEQGPMATSLDAFRKYQLEDAWIWEQLALTKARPVYSTGDLGNQLSAAIAEALKKKKPTTEVRKSISDMRDRIQQQYGNDSPWNIKHMTGGLMDTEFIIQSYVLLNVEKIEDHQPTNSSETVEILHSLGVLEPAEHQLLKHAAGLWTNLLWLYRLTLDAPVSSEDIPKGVEKRFLIATGCPSMRVLIEEIEKTRKQINSMFLDKFRDSSDE